jgi:hypothetical protein
MPGIDSSSGAGKRRKAPDLLEGYVRYCLVNNPGIFQNHSLEPLPRMVAVIPGQYNKSSQGIDILALDEKRQLWVIEVSRGHKRGALLIKELEERQYADYKPQMSGEWRDAAATRFLERPGATQMLETLFDVSGLDREELESLFNEKFKTHRKAIVVTAGCDVAPVETKASKKIYYRLGQKPRSKIDVPDLMVATDIYTFNSPYAP